MLHRLILASAMVLLPLFAWADIPGDQDPGYQNALGNWLSGEDDLGALRKLAVLARDDNIAAQITLGLIQRRSPSHVHVTKTLTREESRAIFSKQGSRFGTRWMTVAAAVHPLAALLMARNIDDFEAHAIALADAGAILDAISFANIPANQGNEIGTIRALSHPALLPYTKLDLHWFANFQVVGQLLFGEAKIAKEAADMVLSLPPLEFSDQLLFSGMHSYIQFDELSEAREALELRGGALLLHPNLKPVTDFVTEVCPEDTAYHIGLLYHLRGGSDFREALISPLEPVVSTADWQSSGRFQRDFLSQLRLAEMNVETLTSLSPCLATIAFTIR